MSRSPAVLRPVAGRSLRVWTAVLAAGLLFAGCSGGPARSPARTSSGTQPPAGSLAARPAGTVVAFLGDSYTEGQGATSAAHRWSSVLCSGHGWVERNFGVGGSGFLAGAPYAGRVAALVATHPSVVIVSGGVNDLGAVAYSQPAEAGAIDTTFAGLRKLLPHAALVALRPFYPAPPPPALLATIGAEERAAAVAVGGVFVDIGEPLRGRPVDIAADGLHPNDAGHRALARAVDRALRRVRAAGS